jgi:hypothetical protein
MLRKAILFGLLAGIFASPAAGAQQLLMPGVTYEKRLQFTRFGPQAMHILTAPKPAGGLYGLKPVLSNSAALGRERVTSMQRRAEASATVAGVNGDLFTWADGIPSSGLIQDGVLRTTPHPKRSMLGVDVAGNLRVDRISMLGTWQGSGPRRPIQLVNRPPGPQDVLYTPSYGGRRRPATACSTVLSPFRPRRRTPTWCCLGEQARRDADPARRRRAGRRGRRPSGWPSRRSRRTRVTVRLVLRPNGATCQKALGGGPELIRRAVDLPARRRTSAPASTGVTRGRP